MPVTTLNWASDHLRMIDQTLLPETLKHLECRDVPTVAEAIKMLRVRGAPAIGVAAAYGVVVAAQEAIASGAEPVTHIRSAIDVLASTRPTAVNLFWALDRMGSVLDEIEDQSAENIREVLLDEANRVFEEDKDTCRRIGKNGAELLAAEATVLTHCNAGGLATADYGTALAVVYAAAEAGKNVAVYADETRPLLQGSRLTAWELQQNGIDVTVICDSMAASVLRDKPISSVIVGADRIAANGDVANKIGTYGLAILANEHDVPFYVAAPLSTIDMSLAEGSLIPIEERDPVEITNGMGKSTAPENVSVYNPAFDVTPNRLVSAIITEKGVARAPYDRIFKTWFA
jgi:methylthioribose-1-phosphate isomerase